MRRLIDRAAAAPVGVRIIGVALVYYVAARWSLRLALVERNVTPFWPPTGIAVVAFLAIGPRVWPAIAAGAFFVNVTISPSPLVAAAIAVGNTLAPFVASRVLRATGFRRDLGRLRDAASLVFFAALPGTLISATVGSATLLWSGTIRPEAFVATWSVWWTGDAMGILVFTPLFLTLSSLRLTGRIDPVRSLEAVLLAAAVVATSVVVLRSATPLFVVVFPPLCWAAWRFQQRGASPAVAWISTVATWAAVHNQGLFGRMQLLDKMLALQAFNAAISFTSLFLATAIAERLRAEEERRRLLVRDRETQAELYRREQRIAETLQRSMLPDRLPDVPDVAVVARYVPASQEVEVGGDWYDVTQLADGRIAIAIGDVAGHGLRAAAAMGQLRMALRAYAVEMLAPAAALERLNMVLRESDPAVMATVLYVQLDPDSGRIELASAGHPPPLLVSPRSGAHYLEAGLAPPLGVRHDLSCASATTEIETGATLVLYTDGLVERRGEAISGRLDLLASVASDAPQDLDGLCDHLLGSLVTAGHTDDVALVALRRVSLRGRPLDMSRPADPNTAAEVRRVLKKWLLDNGADDDTAFDIVVACSEACANAIQHAYGPAGGPVRVRAEIQGEEAVVAVRDFGVWRPPELTRGQGAGRGLKMMRGTMDSVDVTSGAEGTEVTMRRNLRIGVPHP